jgi:hypothetical protein
MTWMKCLLPAALLACSSSSTAPATFEVTSPQVVGGTVGDAQLYDGFGCTGGNASPEVEFHNVPSSAKSLALTLYDIDGGYWHWIVYDLPSSVTSLAANTGSDAAKLPAGAKMATNSFGTATYDGPCPPQGKEHHYTLTAYALDQTSTTLGDAGASKTLGSGAVAEATLSFVVSN